MQNVVETNSGEEFTSTHAHSAEADAATANRQQSMAIRMHGQRLLIHGPPACQSAGLLALFYPLHQIRLYLPQSVEHV